MDKQWPKQYTFLACMFRFLNVGLNLKRNLLLVFSYIMRTNVREWGEIWEKQFSRVLLHDLHWEYKPYKLKRSFTKLLLTKTVFVRSNFGLCQKYTGFQRLFQLFLHFIKEIHRINGTLHPLNPCESSCKHLASTSVGSVYCGPSYKRPR